ncbi:MAG: hypothetical protein O7I93_17720 [Gemmatimonadetes bacterium]|nr:hypothetical protein [Gemmatimonadota bacterium]
MTTLLLAALLVLGPPPQDDAYLYQVTLIRAAPGHLLDVIEEYRERIPVYDAAGDPRPVLVRHSQGDHWDLMAITPVQSLSSYYSAERVARRVAAGEAAGVSPHQFAARLQEIVSWREDTFFSGVHVDEFRRQFNAAGYFHIEMFVALPGKGPELYRERVMENEYLRRIGRPQNLIFAKALGGAWDAFTLGFYRNLQHFAESVDIPAELQAEAAVAAGFESASTIGTYLRELIARHNDTLANKVVLY